MRRDPNRITLGERASVLFNALTGTWTAAFFWTALTVVWWLHAPPAGGWAKAVADDVYPFTFWGAVVSYVTLVQEIVIRAGQRAQQAREAVMARSMQAAVEGIYVLAQQARDADAAHAAAHEDLHKRLDVITEEVRAIGGHQGPHAGADGARPGVGA